MFVSMYVARVPNRGSPPAILLRESYRENGRVKTHTLANLSHWSADKLAAFEAGYPSLPRTPPYYYNYSCASHPPIFPEVPTTACNHWCSASSSPPCWASPGPRG